MLGQGNTDIFVRYTTDFTDAISSVLKEQRQAGSFISKLEGAIVVVKRQLLTETRKTQ
jgi:hypothetical protein